MKNVVRVIGIILLLCYVTAVLAEDPVWVKLGTRKVKARTERDVIHVGEKEGTFTAIKLKIRKSGIHLKDLKVHFENGGVFDVQVRKLIPAGGETRVIDLPGGKRYIEKVVFWYESTERNSKLATVRLWARR